MLVFLTTADTDLLALHAAVEPLPSEAHPVRAFNLSRAVETEEVLARIRSAERPVVVAHLLGGLRAWREGILAVAAAVRERDGWFLPAVADAQPDPELLSLARAPAGGLETVAAYLAAGGVENLREFVRWCGALCSGEGEPSPLPPPASVPEDGLYRGAAPDDGRARVAVLFYRAHLIAGNTGFVDAILDALDRHGCAPVAVYCQSLKDRTAGELFARYLMRDGQPAIDCCISTLSFAMAQVTTRGPDIAEGLSADALAALDVPVLQALVSTAPRDAWSASSQGLGPLDTAMVVAMPEFDGRIITVPVSFKRQPEYDARLGTAITRYEPDMERVDLLARMAARWAALRRTPNAEKRVAIVLHNYPTKAARIGNAVGLDTPASAVRLLSALRWRGYAVGPAPEDGDALMRALVAQMTYDEELLTEGQLAFAGGRWPVERYGDWLVTLPERVRGKVEETWREPPGTVYARRGQFVFSALRFGNVFVTVQPPRGFGENPVAIYHDPDLAPTHHYLAFYQWLRDGVGAQAIVHLGKHGCPH